VATDLQEISAVHLVPTTPRRQPVRISYLTAAGDKGVMFTHHRHPSDAVKWAESHFGDLRYISAVLLRQAASKGPAQ
jgi:hypothetical protein